MDHTPTETVAGPPPDAPSEGFRRSDVARAVKAFHLAFGLPVRSSPNAYIGVRSAGLRSDLLSEEFDELVIAIDARDIVGIADVLADIVYVAYGTALTYGIDLDAVLAEVHRANMSKLDSDGRPVLRDDGKVLKSDEYRPPDVARVLFPQEPAGQVSCRGDHLPHREESSRAADGLQRAEGHLARMADDVQALVRGKGWEDGAPRTFGDEIALLHSEVSEALEAYRVGGLVDQTGPGDLSKPEGVGSEFADILIRLLYYSRVHGIDLQVEYDRKMMYNRGRGHRHGDKRL